MTEPVYCLVVIPLAIMVIGFCGPPSESPFGLSLWTSVEPLGVKKKNQATH